MSFYNTHTHIFNVPCVPDAFITNYNLPVIASRLVRFSMKSKLVRKILLGILKNLPDNKLRRYAALVEVAMNKYQDEVFADLMSNYSSEARFVILTMNFDYMTGEAPAGNYNHYSTQLHEVLEARKTYGAKLIPFVFIDPREGEQECLNKLNTCFSAGNNLGFGGIKIYPSLGYYPFHPAMEKVYAFAEAHQIPIITHSNKDGGAYYSGRFTPQLMSYNSFNPTPESTVYLNHELTPFPEKKDARYYANIMMHPLCYYDVLRKFPNLKICLAHFGGDIEVLAQEGNDPFNWTKAIKALMREFPHVYTDVSFTLHSKDANNVILKDMEDPTLNRKILFGTDYFMTTPYDKDKVLADAFFGQFGAYREQLSVENPKAFLLSDFYTP